jgi:hypothetical protein
VNECKRIYKLLSVADWDSEFYAGTLTDVPLGSNAVLDLLSSAVTGAQDCPGTNRITTYLSVEQTRAVAQLLKPLSSECLARRHHLSDIADSEGDFYQFRKFYLRAAELECGVLVYLLPQ